MAEAGDRIPDVTLYSPGPEGPQPVQSGEYFASGRTVLFGVPGAFTPGCSRTHLPGFIDQADELKAKGVDRIACIAVNDAFVMGAWAEAHDAGDKVTMLADGSAELTEALGLAADMSGFGFGTRSQRFAAIIDDGVITRIDVDPAGQIEASSCGTVLLHLDDLAG